jgi:hypothetical protein
MAETGGAFLTSRQAAARVLESEILPRRGVGWSL